MSYYFCDGDGYCNHIIGYATQYPDLSHWTKDFTEEQIRTGKLVKIGGQWCGSVDVVEADGIKYCARPMDPGSAIGGYPRMARPHPLKTVLKPEQKHPSQLQTEHIISPIAPHGTNPANLEPHRNRLRDSLRLSNI